MSNPNIKYRIELTSEQREELIEISKNGKKTAKQVNYSNVLLMADDNAVAGRWRDEDISQALNMHINTVASIRKKFVLEGVKPALQRKYRETPPNLPKLDGKQEAHSSGDLLQRSTSRKSEMDNAITSKRVGG